MNIVFWLLIVIILVVVWFCLSFAFIGSVGLWLWNDAKKEIEGEEPEKSKKSEEDSSNER